MRTESIPAQLAAAEERTRPCNSKAFAVIIDRLFKFARAFGLPNPAPGDATRVYADALIDVPEDLLNLAVSEALKSWRWGNRLPMPADLRVMIADELRERKRDRTTFKLMADKLTGRPAPNHRAGPSQIDVILAKFEAPSPKSPLNLEIPGEKFNDSPLQDADMRTAASLPPEERKQFWLGKMNVM